MVWSKKCAEFRRLLLLTSMAEYEDRATSTIDWVLPASIPFADLKGLDLEACVYWLFDALGAKDLEWRTGGSGGGAADGGRDLEAHFYTPSIDDELEPQVWWIECKGRSGTVEKAQIQEAANNALAKDNLDYLVIATNTQFSNPTRDWVKEWQAKHKRPKVKLWDSEHLERMLSKHPTVVLRLFSDGLSTQGRVQAMEARFWNRLEYSSPSFLKDIWKERKELEFSPMSMFAAIVSEFSNGEISKRSWGTALDTDSLVEALYLALLNVSYLFIRSSKSGSDQTPIIRGVSYLIMCALRKLESQEVVDLVRASLFRGKEEAMPDEVQEFLLMPIVNQLLLELQDVCSDDCVRMSAFRTTCLTQSNDEINTYWQRFDATECDVDEESENQLSLEQHNAPCKVGFTVNKNNGCPLFGIEAATKNLSEAFTIAKRVIEVRIAQEIEAI